MTDHIGPDAEDMQNALDGYREGIRQDNELANALVKMAIHQHCVDCFDELDEAHLPHNRCAKCLDEYLQKHGYVKQDKGDHRD